MAADYAKCTRIIGGLSCLTLEQLGRVRSDLILYGHRVMTDTCVEVPEAVISKLIAWRLEDPRYYDYLEHRSHKMGQRQWTIEARANFLDKDKVKIIDAAVTRAAVHVNAELALLLAADGSGQKPQVVAFSDDFFHGHNELALIPDSLGKAIKDHADIPDADSGISDEMLQAVRDMQHDANNG